VTQSGSTRLGLGTLSVKKGQRINWTNDDDSSHQVSVASESLKTGVLLKGQSGQHSAPGPGRPGLRSVRNYSELYN